MQREERRRKFHQSLLNVLYPPPPSPRPPQGRDDEEEHGNILRDCLNVDLISDELGESGSEDECGPQKLTRAQRKRLRKKKLKEAASRHRILIGPLLPTPSDDDDGLGDLSNEAQGVRCNAPEKPDTVIDKPGELVACTNQNKKNNRRMAKKMAKERSVLSISENCHQDCGPCSNNESLTQES